MTDKNLNPDVENEANKPVKPRISKASAATNEPLVSPAIVASPTPKPALKSKVDTLADGVSLSNETLLQIDTYEEAEQLLTEHPDLIEQARAVFGTIVPTSNQNQFMELAIRAAAEDDPIDLRGAIKIKRQQNFSLVESEVEQVLEFAKEHVHKSSVLALSVILLLTDDLTRLGTASLWQKQKEVVLILEKVLNLDVAALWEEISQEEVKVISEPAPAPELEPQPVEIEVKTKKLHPVPPPPPLRRSFKKKKGSPPRWFLASGFIFLMSLMSCGTCFFGSFFPMGPHW